MVILYTSCAGGNADFTMDMHQKEQLHDNPMSMMQSQHYPVSHGFCVEHAVTFFISSTPSNILVFILAVALALSLIYA